MTPELTKKKAGKTFMEGVAREAERRRRSRINVLLMLRLAHIPMSLSTAITSSAQLPTVFESPKGPSRSGFPVSKRTNTTGTTKLGPRLPGEMRKCSRFKGDCTASRSHLASFDRSCISRADLPKLCRVAPLYDATGAARSFV